MLRNTIKYKTTVLRIRDAYGYPVSQIQLCPTRIPIFLHPFSRIHVSKRPGSATLLSNVRYMKHVNLFNKQFNIIARKVSNGEEFIILLQKLFRTIFFLTSRLGSFLPRGFAPPPHQLDRRHHRGPLHPLRIRPGKDRQHGLALRQ
jgi:hypothetical protein